MQSPLESPTRLAERIDRFGLYALVLLISCGWFYLLWGAILPSLSAGVALALLVLQTVRLGEKRTLARRETALRRRIGGEMAVDSLLLQSPANAVSNAAAWLSQALTLTDFATKEHGMIAQHTQGAVWIECLQRHASAPADCDEILATVRNAREENADICIVCSTSDFTSQASALAEDLTPRTRLLGRAGLIGMAGLAAPATNEQLQTLGKRRKQKFRKELLKARILDPTKKRRYAIYGIGLSLLYVLTKQILYAIPALVCLLLFAFCRRKASKVFTL